jgi:CHAT domain-containing protein
MLVPKTRVATAVLLLVHATASALLAQGARQSARSPPTTVVPAVNPATARQLLDQVSADLIAGRAVDGALAARMLALNCRDAPMAEMQMAQAIYCQAILLPAVVAARENVDSGAEKLAEVWARSDALLRRQGIPSELILAQKVYLALYQLNLPDKAPLRATLDSISDAMTSDLVWPGMRGIYWNLRGLLAGEDSQYSLALDCYTRALAMWRDAKLPEDQAQSLSNLGHVLFRMGDHAAARQVLDEACAQYAAIRQARMGVETDGELTARMNRAKAWEGSQEFELALRQYEDLMACAQRFPVPIRDRLDFQFRNNAAIARYSLGEFDVCESELAICRGVAARELGEHALNVAEIDINLGWVALAKDKKELADQRFQSAVANLRTNHPTHHRYAEGLGYLARAKATLNQMEQARTLLEEAVRLREQQMDATLASALSERDRLAYVQQLRVHPDSPAWPGALDTYLELAPLLSISDERQYDRVLKWKGILARDRARDNAHQADDEARAIEAERAVIRMRLLALAAAVRRKEPDALAEMTRLEREANALERRLRGMRREAQPPGNPVRRADVAAALPVGAMLVDLIEVRRYKPRSEGERVVNDRVYIAFLVSPSGDVRRIDLGRSALIDSPAVQFRQWIETSNEENRDFKVPARRLNELIGRKLREELGDVEQVILAADGALQHVPWAALPGVQKAYWVQELTITTVPSAVALVAGRKRAGLPKSNAWLAVGGVDYGDDPAAAKQKWKPLDNTQAEASGVDRMLTAAFGNSADPPTLLTGRDANKQRIKDLLGRRRQYIHLATHGEFQQRKIDAFGAQDALASLDSVLVLAGANLDTTGGAQSLLTAEEIAALDLSSVDLMVLSACQTGLGHVQSGQGQVGLVNALSKAGVGTVVASLWKVDDNATARLMERFYTHALKRGNRTTVSAALRQAQLDLLAEPNRQHPYLWAAWGVTGQPDCILGN